MEEKKSIFEVLPRKQVFIFGAIFSFFMVTSIGFFVLLFKMFSL